ncbi:uncharacterized protein LOC129225869 isoform X1 [Uloborus diversus]|uniref:uncharacterized protein LOC129225869 isoform X1 n=1 Tax=Uloborus diversus TaxID=327109 RepID=UPI002409C264|nr:uncharacterized protein LOC129225869 isoform X1 [Uloborus diversus]XP_054716369.1 uncharacterized protein LOC129225869 isoform X1 [Uloborus diversus]XP_054716370.1 uncharacterized protein LOC129225869 isoform X1 [Uloborus diversus]XP_054716371.1 uncharacterized protein LOC129225869 isoform X1 [Uloborus diversus]
MSTEDARPFASLKHNAENFISDFNQDIVNCSALLNEKITDLIRDPDSLGASTHLKKGADAHVEFSKAKLNIFLSMKSHFDEIEEKWSSMIQQMKKDFLENVEIFLAETKLEVKLPPSPSITSKKSRLSFSSGKQEILQAVSSSIYPLISSITTKVPGLKSSQEKGYYHEDRIDDDEESNSDNSCEQEELPKPPVKKGGRPLKRGTANILNEFTGLKSSQMKGYYQDNPIENYEESNSDNSCQQEELPKPPVKKGGRPSRRDTANTINESLVEYPKQPLKKGGRPRKGATNGFNDPLDLSETAAKVNMTNTRRAAKPASSGTPKSTSRRKIQTRNSDEEMEPIIEQAAEDITNEFEMLSTTTKSRRKTMFVPQISKEDLSDEEPNPEKILRVKSKRKNYGWFIRFHSCPITQKIKI